MMTRRGLLAALFAVPAALIARPIGQSFSAGLTCAQARRVMLHARERVIIDELYVHRSRELLDALVEGLGGTLPESWRVQPSQVWPYSSLGRTHE